MMKMILKATLMGAALSVSIPALACPGEAAQQATATVPQKDIQLTGVVTQEGCPMEAAEAGCTGYVLTADNNKGRYMIFKSDVSSKLLTKVKKAARVQVKGDVLDQDGRAMLNVTTFKVMGNA